MTAKDQANNNGLVGSEKRPLGFSFAHSDELKRLVAAIVHAGGKPIAVGGCVRDTLLGLPAKDVDVEVYGLTPDALEATLGDIGKVISVGKSFAVLKVTIDGTTFDVSLPRTENKTGQGHRAFSVEANPHLTFKEAARRRDFTINAMGIDLVTGALLDEHGGQQDLDARILRHVSPQFAEDPLRVFRAAQFAARFKLTLAPETIELCRSLRDELRTLPLERIYEEMQKLMLGIKPSLGLTALLETQALSYFPELVGLIGCPQDPEWHPEGDVWIHTLMVVDEAAGIARRDGLLSDGNNRVEPGNRYEALVLTFGALCHDLGKPTTTRLEAGRLRSKNHEAAGEKPTRSFMQAIGAPQGLIEDIIPLVIDHLKPAQLYKVRDNVSDAAIRRLSARVNIERLCRVAEADFLGRTTEDALKGFDPSVAWLKEQASRLEVSRSAPPPLLLGRHLIEHGLKPGPRFKNILDKAFDAQLDGVFSDLDGALAWLKKNV
jgi:tRNA nucleotidyltransferase (CCA-adding enzyme)